MAPRGKNSKSAGFIWTDERKAYLLECWQEITLANEARPVGTRSNIKQLSAELRRLFCSRFSGCKFAAATLYKYVNDIANARPVPVSKTTSFWNNDTDEFLIECVALAQQDNIQAVQQGLLSGKRGRPSTYRKLLIELFTARYPNIAANSVFQRVTELRKQKRISDVEPQKPTSANTDTPAKPPPPQSAASADADNSNDIDNAGRDTPVAGAPDLTAFYQCTMRHWEFGYQFASRPIFVGACSRCSTIMTADSIRSSRKLLHNPVSSDGVPPPQANVYRYYTAGQVKLSVTNANGQWYRCSLCSRIDLLAQYPVAPTDTVRNLPLPKCIADLTEPADRRAIALVALNAKVATKRSDALRVFEHLRGEFAVSHRDDKQYYAMYAMIVNRYGQHTTTAASATGHARILVQRALKWLKLNNPLYRMFAANYETLLRYQPRKPGQPKSLQLFGNVDFQPMSTRLSKISLLESEQCGMYVPADNVGTRGVSSVGDTVTGTQHVRDFESAARSHGDVCQVTYGDSHLEAKLFPWLLPYGTGGWSVHDGQRGVTRATYIRWRISMCEQRFRREPEYMFFFLDILIKERLQYYASVRVNVANLEAPLTKQQVDKAAKRAKDDPYALLYGTEMPATIPNSRNYWATKTLDLLAMSTQMGRQPDFFITLTENDSWPELQAVICRGVAASHQATDRKDQEDVHRFGRPAMNHPVETVVAFYNRLQVFRRRVLHNPTGPIGNVQDYFLRIEYQKRGSLHAHQNCNKIICYNIQKTI